ncbi:sensor histidine kinase [Sphingobacterium deserti]|uniref:histidine kinase n=1 Tax=Sphingobacterium deserti TaxID=1229276 RepID=A0A0B8T218_9SPHI|nr:HAMP domain-containing sensor histidine kinase [Sphingobacterium deserti]KGE14861.1 integral membrane sensor signal transduction histidine kinase [Sphingobacterium deserti]
MSILHAMIINKDRLYQYEARQRWKVFLFTFAALIAGASMFYTNYLVKSLSQSERTKAEVWAMSTRSIVTMPDVDDQFISFVYAVRDSLSIPAIITNEKGNIIFWRGLDSTKTNIKELQDSADHQLVYDPIYFEKQLARMKRNHAPIDLHLDTGEIWSVYYRDSDALRQLRIFPYLQLSLIAIFLIIAYTVFNSIKKTEQNLVWVGMAKEAAHQLGTPISSLMGWLELVRTKFDAENDSILNEMERDVKRLEIVADRFSKIGSTPTLNSHMVFPVIQDFVQYFRVRTSEKITFQLTGDQTVEAKLNVPLFDWIIENLLKNAVNAIESEGKITVNIIDNIAKEEIFIDISDTGRGIPKSNFDTVFQPGFTTRKRGWGLGLSLTKRMVDYHQGQIFVKESELGKGTTFRIILKSNLRYEPTQV